MRGSSHFTFAWKELRPIHSMNARLFPAPESTTRARWTTADYETLPPYALFDVREAEKQLY